MPVVEIGLLRSLRLFAALPPPAIEGLARSLVAASARGRRGDHHARASEGDRYYAIAEGELEVLVDGVRVNTLGRGDGFGEIALLHEWRGRRRCGR